MRPPGLRLLRCTSLVAANSGVIWWARSGFTPAWGDFSRPVKTLRLSSNVPWEIRTGVPSPVSPRGTGLKIQEGPGSEREIEQGDRWERRNPFRQEGACEKASHGELDYSSGHATDGAEPATGQRGLDWFQDHALGGEGCETRETDSRMAGERAGGRADGGAGIWDNSA